MAEIPKNVNELTLLAIEPKAKELLLNRFPVETMLLASIAISLRRIAEGEDNGKD